MEPEYYTDVPVFTRWGFEEGRTTGAYYPCQMAGCIGSRLVVKWADGSNTRPCSKGMAWDHTKNVWTSL